MNVCVVQTNGFSDLTVTLSFAWQTSRNSQEIQQHESDFTIPIVARVTRGFSPAGVPQILLFHAAKW